MTDISKWIVAGLAALTGFFALPKKSQSISHYTDYDLDTLARTLWGEARGEGYTGMQAVANVIMNRYAQAQSNVAKAQQFGGTVADICKKPYQFSVWNATDSNYHKIITVTQTDSNFAMAWRIAKDALNGSLLDITGGADHYHTSAINPKWSKGQTPVAVVQNHEFYKLA